MAALSVLFGISGFGQTTFATLTGSVTDPNGSAIAGVAVEAVHLGSNYRYTTKSNEAGIYTIGQLREGIYNLRAAIPGFKEAVIFNVGLSKYFAVTERVRIRWELTATNSFNHPNWANPQPNISSLGQVGVITGRAACPTWISPPRAIFGWAYAWSGKCPCVEQAAGLLHARTLTCVLRHEPVCLL